MFFSDSIRQWTCRLRSSSWPFQLRASTQSSGEVRLVKDLDRSIMGRDVIIVEDIVDSGMTLHFHKKLLITRGAASLRIAALMDKPARRVAPLEVDYSCFQIPDAFVVGYGLDYNERYRNLPDVGVLSPPHLWGKCLRKRLFFLCFPKSGVAREGNKNLNRQGFSLPVICK